MAKPITTGGPRKVVLLSGAYTAGIGSSIRTVLQDAGWSIIALYDPSDKLQSGVADKDSESIKIPVDFKNPESVRAIVDQLPPHLDAFVNAEMFFQMDATFSQEIWAHTLQVNVIAPAQIVELLRDRLRDGGAIVAITSTEAFMGSFGSAAYSASRAAMHNLVQSWANKLGPEHIRANAVAAGWIGGVMDTDEIFNQSRKITPLGRLGLPEEVAGTVKFLCSGEASFINGSVVTVDGGYSGVDSMSKYEYREHLASADFYRFESEFILGHAGIDDEIWAVCMMFPGEWDESEESLKFNEDQLAAVGRGAEINRVLVVPSDLKLTESHPAVRFHRSDSNIHCYKIDHAELEKKDPELLKLLGDGWTALGDQIAILDDAEGEEPRGTLVSSASRLAELRGYFERLKTLAKPL